MASLPDLDASLVSRLVASQFPQWGRLPVSAVVPGGVDNRTFRLGDRLSVRLPAGPWYAQQVAKEQRWLPVLADRLPLPIPTPLGLGRPDEGYPYPWSVYGWIEGQSLAEAPVGLTPGSGDLQTVATDLATFLVALRRADPMDGPGPGEHTFFRGGPLSTYHEETIATIAGLGEGIDADACRAIWDTATGAGARWTGAPVWFHGDVAPGNLLVRGGRLAAVIDFGTSGVGDPACDLVVAWTLFHDDDSRAAFREVVDLDEGAWARGRGWALWKALITVAVAGDDSSPGRRGRVAAARHTLDALLTDRW